MTPNFPPTPNSPLSLQGEGWGEGALNPNTYAPGKPPARASSLLQKTPQPHPSPYVALRTALGIWITTLSE
ncbi:hypothetical protein Pssp01_26840 [Pseudomonas sp. NBRC 100443]|nr:hypothetical protein Pssp01_26840 [Pseudomonas sp. NBRC 100443]